MFDSMKTEVYIRPVDRFEQAPSTYEFYIAVYPSKQMEDKFYTIVPLLYAGVVVLIFFFTAFIFYIYDSFVQHRQKKMLASLDVTSKVMASLFPATVLDRLMKEAEEQAKNEAAEKEQKLGLSRLTQKAKLRDFLDSATNPSPFERTEKGEESLIVFKSKPIADLYTSATIMFADIVGFTAWSSTREPTQVFTLLESLFSAYDTIAKRRRIFKVETIALGLSKTTVVLSTQPFATVTVKV